MNLLLYSNRLTGSVVPPPSKSESHRLMLAAALAEGESSLHGLRLSDDLRATLDAARAFGARAEETSPGEWRVIGCGARRSGKHPLIDCGQSASTLRFALPIALALCGGGSFAVRGRLPDRPMRPYTEVFDERGIAWKLADGRLTVHGELRPGDFRLNGEVSSQFFSGLLFALPLLDGPSTLRWTSPPVSEGYLRLTAEILRQSGILLREREDGYDVSPSAYQPLDAAPEADWSQAAFWIAARELGSRLTVCGLNENSLQPDRCVSDMAARLREDGDLTLNVSQCPDLLPPLAVLAALRRGCCRLSGAARLRGKESDRLASVAAALGAMGAEIREEPDGLWIRGRDSLPGEAAVDCAGDHRIAMAAAVAATRCEKPVLLHGAESVNKSYPDFWEHFQRLGGRCDVVELGE